MPCNPCTYGLSNFVPLQISHHLYIIGSFACALDADSYQIIVTGGGSRHSMFVAAGSRISFVEWYDVASNEWMEMDELPRFRAGCVRFFVRDGDEREFWVLGGYGECMTVSRFFPVDDYYRDAAVMTVNNNDCMKWREVEDMWGEGARTRVGKIVVLENQHGGIPPDVFMLDWNDICSFV